MITEKELNEAIQTCHWRQIVHGIAICRGNFAPCNRLIGQGKCVTLIELFGKKRKRNEVTNNMLLTIVEENPSWFEHELSTYVDNEELYFCLEYCGIQQWNEGVLICEHEIAKRELNKGSVVVERFEL